MSEKKENNVAERVVDALYNVGADAGNDSIKLQIGLNKKKNYDNIYCQAVQTQIYVNEYGMNRDLDGMLDVTVTSHSADGELIVSDIYFGDMAKDFKENTVERDKGKKHSDGNLITSTVVAIGNYLISDMLEKMQNDILLEMEIGEAASEDEVAKTKANAFEEAKNRIKKELIIDINLSTGLPYNEYIIDSMANEFKNRFLGEHIIVFNSPYYPVDKLILNIKSVEISTEGGSALRTALAYKNIKKQYTFDDLYESAWAMADIGCYTSDIVSGIFNAINDEEETTNNLRFDNIPTLGTGLVTGVGTAYDNTIEIVEESLADTLTNGETITKKDIAKAMKSKTRRGFIRGKRIDILPYVQPELRRVGETVGKEFVKLYTKAGYKRNIFKIYLAGGGALIPEVVEGFTKALKDSNYEIDVIEILSEPDPVYANAFGYYLKICNKK